MWEIVGHYVLTLEAVMFYGHGDPVCWFASNTPPHDITDSDFWDLWIGDHGIDTTIIMAWSCDSYAYDPVVFGYTSFQKNKEIAPPFQFKYR